MTRMQNIQMASEPRSIAQTDPVPMASPTPVPIRVMIVDDHPIVRDGLKNMLLAFDDLQFAGAAADGAEALACYRQQQPDVILMDMAMPGMDGIAVTRAILAKQPAMKIIMLTSFVDDNTVQRALAAGAVGYLMKNVAINTMAEVIRAAHAGQPSLSPEATAALIRAKTGSHTLGSDLSERERQVLALIVTGLNNEEIAEQLVISPATARHHVSACLQKLGAANRAQAAVLATRHQLVP